MEGVSADLCFALGSQPLSELERELDQGELALGVREFPVVRAFARRLEIIQMGRLRRRTGRIGVGTDVLTRRDPTGEGYG